MRMTVSGSLRASPIVLTLLLSAHPLVVQASSTRYVLSPEGRAAPAEQPPTLAETARIAGNFRISFGADLPKVSDVDRKAERPIRKSLVVADQARNLYRNGDSEGALALLTE